MTKDILYYYIIILVYVFLAFSLFGIQAQPPFFEEERTRGRGPSKELREKAASKNALAQREVHVV